MIKIFLSQFMFKKIYFLSFLAKIEIKFEKNNFDKRGFIRKIISNFSI